MIDCNPDLETMDWIDIAPKKKKMAPAQSRLTRKPNRKIA